MQTGFTAPRAPGTLPRNMTIFLLLLVLLAACLRLKRPCIEVTLGVLFASPVVFFGLGSLLGASTVASYIALASVAVLIFKCSTPYDGSKVASFNISRREEWLSSIALVAAYIFLYRVALLWPDFISIGERLRDYAILAATYRDPLAPPEPWMSGTVLNYYVYWYRFGQFIGSLFGEPVWAIYHQMAALSLAAYFACCFRILLLHFKFSALASVTGALVIALGSNWSGITHALTRDGNWWGPSRVINGAINEFPAWSFLLGDLHPHYLNLCALPLLASIVLLSLRSGWTGWRALNAISVWAILAPCWLYAANAWELPVWALLTFWGAVALALMAWKEMPAGSQETKVSALREHFASALSPRTVALGVSAIALAGVLIWSTLHLRSPDNFELEFVQKPLLRTPVASMFQHWGIPLVFIALGLVVRIMSNDFILGIVGAAILVLGAFFGEDALLPLVFLLLVALIYFVVFLRQENPERTWSPGTKALAAALPLAFVSAILFPEIAFVNDAYGDDIERMNTIFKFYSAAWWFGWMAMFVVGREAFAHVPARFRKGASQLMPAPLVVTCVLVLMLGFFYRTIPMRKTERFSVGPFTQGLSTVDQRFPGAADTIKKLSTQEGAVILEAQGNAYDYTTFVATLSGQQSFLGWGNHVGLLTNKYDEVRRREEFTNSWYREEDCGKRKTMLLTENISHVVIGSLEKQKFGESASNNLNCLTEFARSAEYLVITP